MVEKSSAADVQLLSSYCIYLRYFRHSSAKTLQNYKNPTKSNCRIVSEFSPT